MKIPTQSNQQHRTKGFTLVELLVTMLIIVIVASLSVLGISKLRLSAHKAVSMNNIRSLSNAALTVAVDGGGVFVGIHSVTEVPYRFTRKFRDDYGITRSTAYCPANRYWKQDGYDHKLKRELWDFGGGDSVWGYTCMVNDAQTANGSGWATGAFLKPENWERIKDSVTYAEGNETKVRWVPERLNQEVAYPILFTDLMRNYEGKVVGNFMNNDSEPLGVYVGYMDGHVEWVDGKNMKARYTGGGAQVYW